MKYILNQTISSTHMDSHGEKNTKVFLEDLASRSGNRIPLHQQHNMGMETLGYIENFRVIEDESSPGEWLLKADVYFTCETIDEALKGFSFSTTEPITDNFANAKYFLYLPWPHYNDEEFIREIITSDSDFAVGKWRKKHADLGTIGLIVSGITFVLAPLWTNVYNDQVAPHIRKAFSNIPNLLRKNMSVDFVQQVIDSNGSTIQIHFIPNRGSEEESLRIDLLCNGLKCVESFLSSDKTAKTVGAFRIKLMYDIKLERYRLLHVQYKDGTDRMLA